MIDVAEAIDAEAELAQISTRDADTYDIQGNAVKGALTPADAMVTFQPMTGRDLRNLPEGLRDVVTLVAWSRSPVNTDDVVVRSGVQFCVMHVWDRPADGFNKFALGRLVE